MVPSTISRARLHDLATPGRSALAASGGAGSREGCTSPRRLLIDATRIAEETPQRPKAPSSRPGSADLVEATI
jgi:hypothetical protein